MFNLGPADKHRQDEEVLGAYLTLIDDLFFFGSLSERCTLVMIGAVGTNRLLKGQTVNCIGYKLQWKLLRLERYLEAEITIFTRREKNRSASLEKYLEKLLHEMIHAFFNVWGCLDASHSEWQVIGVKGHGYAFQRYCSGGGSYYSG